MKKNIKWILLAVVLVVLAAGGFYYSNMPLAVETITMVPEKAELYFTEQGIASDSQPVSVYSLANGKILSVDTDENVSIKKGDVICVVSDEDYVFDIESQKLEIIALEAQIKNLSETEKKEKDNLQISRNNLLGQLQSIEGQQSAGTVSTSEQLELQRIIIEQNRLDLEKARNNLANMDLLLKSGAVSRNQYDEAKKLRDELENQLRQNEQKLYVIENGTPQTSDEYFSGQRKAIEAQITGIDKSMASSYISSMQNYYKEQISEKEHTISRLNEKIKDCTITSPVDGIVTTLNVKNTNILDNTKPVAIIRPTGERNVEVYVTTQNVDSISLGQEVELILKRQAGDKVFSGQVTKIADEAIVKLSALGVEERRVKVTVSPTTGIDEIKAGYDADVKFNTYSESNKLIVPKTALFKANDKDMVWTVSNGKAKMTEVVKGMELRTGFVIESGLNPDDKVITNIDLTGLDEGKKVKSLG